MKNTRLKPAVENILEKHDIKINGNRPWDIKIYNDKFYKRVLNDGSLGLGESYMEGWWDCKNLDAFIYRLLSIDPDKVIKPWIRKLLSFKDKFSDYQKGKKAFYIGQHHYDIGNDLYKSMLDNRMIYSCGYWENCENIDQAQEKKIDLVCRKLKLKPGMKVLDIGCGWGGAVSYVAEKYDCDVTGVTVSKEQADEGEKRCRNLPAEIKYCDYKELSGQYDRIFSLGMFEHLGYKNYRTYMKKIRELLKPDGLFLLQTIGSNSSFTGGDPWIRKYIFPNSMLPGAKLVTEACEDLLLIEDWQNLSTDYDKTLMEWYKNFKNNWNSLKPNYSKNFYRMWEYYLLSCAAAFRARKVQVWQIVFSPEGFPGGYQAVR